MRLYLWIILCLLMPTLAFAAPKAAPSTAPLPATEAGATLLKPLLDGVLKQFSEDLKAQGVTLKQDGNLIVEPADSYYAVTTPLLSIVRPDKSSITIGMVAINLVPTSDPTRVKAAIALPTPMFVLNPLGQTIGTLTLGSQSMSGVWSFTATTFVELASRYEQVSLQSQPENNRVDIARIDTSLHLKDNGQGLWSGPSSIAIDNLTAIAADGSKSSMRSLRFNATHDQLDLTLMRVFSVDMQTKLNALAAAKLTGDKAKIETAQKTVHSTLGKYLVTNSNGLQSSLVIDDMAVQYTPAPKTDAKTKGATAAPTPPAYSSIKRIQLDMGTENAKTDNGNFSVALNIDGINAGQSANLLQYSPQSMTAHISGTGVPMKTLAANANTPNTKPLRMQDYPNMALQLKDVQVLAPAFDFIMNGAFKSEPKAKRGTTGNLTISVRGFDEAMAWLGTADGQSVANNIPPQVLGILTMVQMAGQQGKDAEGRAVRSYDLVAGVDGTLKLNGVDFSQLLALSGGGTKPAAKASGQ